MSRCAARPHIHALVGHTLVGPDRLEGLGRDAARERIGFFHQALVRHRPVDHADTLGLLGANLAPGPE